MLEDPGITILIFWMGKDPDLVLVTVYRVGIRVFNDLDGFSIIRVFLQFLQAQFNGIGIISFIVGFTGRFTTRKKRKGRNPDLLWLFMISYDLVQ